MYPRSELYKRLWNAGARIESKVDIENGHNGFTVFGEDKLFSTSTEQHFFADDNPSVGGCCSAEIDIAIRDVDMLVSTFPRMAKMRPYVRLVGTTGTVVLDVSYYSPIEVGYNQVDTEYGSLWFYSSGGAIWWLVTRTTTMTINFVDGQIVSAKWGNADMVVTRPSFVSNVMNVATVTTVSNTMASEWIPRGVFFIDTRKIDTQTNRASIHGYDSMLKTEQIYGVAAQEKTMRQIVLDIATKIGVLVNNLTDISNTWTCQVDTTLTMREYLQYIAAVNGGNFYFDYNGVLCFKKLYCIGEAPNYELLADENSNVIVFGDVSIILKDDPRANLVNVGRSMSSFDISPTFAPFSKVALIVDEDNGTQTVYESGDNTGRELTLACPWGTQAMADYVLSIIHGYAYQPLSSETTIVDPAVELCDGVYTDGYYSGVFTLSTNFHSMATSDISAPADEEIDHEYAYSDGQTKTERKFAKTRASLRVLSGEIESKIDSETAQSLIDQTIDEITLSVTSGANGSSISLTSKGVTITSDEVNIEANSINLATATISGKLTAENIDASELHVAGANIDNLEVTNAMINSLDVSKLYINGSPMYAVSGNQVTSKANTVVPTLRSTGGIYAGSQIGIGSGEQYSDVYLTSDGIQINGGASASWADILTKTYTAKFG